MEPGAAELYDQALLGILQHVGNVQDFLRVLFGFLYRKNGLLPPAAPPV